MNLMQRRMNLINFKKNRLPGEYQEVEYIESTGEQYISINMYGTEKTRIVIDATITKTSVVTQLCGNLVDTSKAISFNLIETSTAITRFGNKSTSGLAYNYVTSDIRTLFDLSNDGYYIDGINRWTPNSSDFTTGGHLRIFAASNSSNKAIGKLYSAKIYENGVLVRDMIPCYRKSDNVVGMYDIVNDVFYTNAGTGTFIKGGNV